MIGIRPQVRLGAGQWAVNTAGHVLVLVGFLVLVFKSQIPPRACSPRRGLNQRNTPFLSHPPAMFLGLFLTVLIKFTLFKNVTARQSLFLAGRGLLLIQACPWGGQVRPAWGAGFPVELCSPSVAVQSCHTCTVGSRASCLLETIAFQPPIPGIFPVNYPPGIWDEVTTPAILSCFGLSPAFLLYFLGM